MTFRDASQPGGQAIRLAAEARFAGLLDAADATEVVVRSAEAARVRALIAAVDCTEQDMVPVQGSEYAHRNLVAEVAVSWRISERSAANHIETATIARALDASVDSLDAGRISYRHLVAIADQAGQLPISAVPEYQDRLLTYAENHSVVATTRRARILRERLHPVSIEERTITARSERRFWVRELSDGMAEIGGILPAVEATAIAGRVTRIATALRSREGETRTLAQLEADAFSDLLLDDECGEAGVRDRRDATRSISRRIKPEVRVTIPLMSMLGRSDDPAELIGFGPLDLATALRLAAQAPFLRRMLTDPLTGLPIAADPTEYRVQSDVRRYVRFRDLRCRFPGCNRRLEATDLDHVIGRLEGGQSVPDNLILLCRHHHRLKDTAGWAVRTFAHGVLLWTSPAGRSVTTDPDPNDLDSAARLQSDDTSLDRPDIFAA